MSQIRKNRWEMWWKKKLDAHQHLSTKNQWLLAAVTSRSDWHCLYARKENVTDKTYVKGSNWSSSSILLSTYAIGYYLSFVWEQAYSVLLWRILTDVLWSVREKIVNWVARLFLKAFDYHQCASANSFRTMDFHPQIWRRQHA
jgi:hypothetical protein